MPQFSSSVKWGHMGTFLLHRLELNEVMEVASLELCMYDMPVLQ